jgi:hypothetical protein
MKLGGFKYFPFCISLRNSEIICNRLVVFVNRYDALDANLIFELGAVLKVRNLFYNFVP